MAKRTPTLANGKICYVELPALDIQRSANFYAKAFDWKVEPLGPDAPATIARFRDPAGNVLGLYQDPGLSKTVR